MTACGVCEATTDGFVCKHCLIEVERAIGDMPSLMHEVSVVVTRQTNVYRASASTQPEPEPMYDAEGHLPAWLRSKDGRTALRPSTLPVNLDAADLLWAAGNTLSTWTRHLCERAGAELPSAEGMLAWLLTNSEAIRWDDAAERIHEEITGLHHDMERAVDRSPSRLYAGPCKNGDCERDLYARPSADEIVCDGYRGDGVGCRATHTTTGRREWLLAELETALVGIEETLDALPVLFPDITRPKRATVLAWVRQGRLTPHGQTHIGEPTFVGGELLTLIREHKPHRYAPRRSRVA